MIVEKQSPQFLFHLSSFLPFICLACWSQPHLLLASLSLLSFSYSSLLSPRSSVSASRLSIRGAPAIQFPCARSPLSVSAPLSCSLRVDSSPLSPVIARHHLLGDGGRKKNLGKPRLPVNTCVRYTLMTRGRWNSEYLTFMLVLYVFFWCVAEWQNMRAQFSIRIALMSLSSLPRRCRIVEGSTQPLVPLTERETLSRSCVFWLLPLIYLKPVNYR